MTTTQIIGTVPNNDTSTPSSVNTGAIVGGVIGGLAVIVLLVGLFVWWRKKTRFDEFEANLFDPDRNVKRPMSKADPHTDLLTTAAIPEAARNITPYSYGTAPMMGTETRSAQGLSVSGQPEARPPSSYYAYDNASNAGGTHHMAGTDNFPNPYGPGYLSQSLVPGAMATGMGAGALGSAALNRGPTVSSTSSSSHYPQSSYPPSHVSQTSPQFSQAQTQPMQVPMPIPTPSPVNPRGAKEREAFQRTHGKGGWAVANQGDSPGGGVVVHQDGGRMDIPEEDEVPRDAEIPPTYESIRPDGHAPTTNN